MGSLSRGTRGAINSQALAEAGYHAVAPDQRGYGQTDSPADADNYTQLHMVGDVIGSVGRTRRIQSGRDRPRLGRSRRLEHRAVAARSRARRRWPERAVCAARPGQHRSPRMRSVFGEGFYMAYFQQPGVADAELARDVRHHHAALSVWRIRRCADIRRRAQAGHPQGRGMLDILAEPAVLPAWLTQADLDVLHRRSSSEPASPAGSTGTALPIWAGSSWPPGRVRSSPPGAVRRRRPRSRRSLSGHEPVDPKSANVRT